MLLQLSLFRLIHRPCRSRLKLLHLPKPALVKPMLTLQTQIQKTLMGAPSFQHNPIFPLPLNKPVALSQLTSTPDPEPQPPFNHHTSSTESLHSINSPSPAPTANTIKSAFRKMKMAPISSSSFPGIHLWIGSSSKKKRLKMVMLLMKTVLRKSLTLRHWE